MWKDTCDVCDGEYTKDNPKYEHRTPRPSDPQDMTCIMATHNGCMGGGKTPEQWEHWIENEGAKQGYLWIS